MSIGEIVGSGSFAEVRKGVLRRRHDGSGDRGETVNSNGNGGENSNGSGNGNDNGGDNGSSNGNEGGGMVRQEGGKETVTEVAMKVLRDIRRRTVRRFWFEVLIMKVRHSARLSIDWLVSQSTNQPAR